MKQKGRVRSIGIVMIALALVAIGGYWWRQHETTLTDELTATTTSADSSQAKAKKSTRSSSTQMPVPYTITPITSQMSVEQITAEFKAEEAALEDLANTLIFLTYNNPEGTCAAIIANRTSHNHAYYLFLAKLNALQAKYGAYRSSISSINAVFKEKYEVRPMIITKCSMAGYRI